MQMDKLIVYHKFYQLPEITRNFMLGYVYKLSGKFWLLWEIFDRQIYVSIKIVGKIQMHL